MHCILHVLMLSIICLQALGCGNSSFPTAAPPIQVAQVEKRPGDPAPGEGNAAALPMARKIIYNGQIDIVVEEMTTAQAKLTSLIETVRKLGGYLARQELTGASGSHRRGTWTIRVPLSEFDGFIAEIEQLGELERSSRDAQDVTEAYADLEARLRNKQSSEQRLLSHLEKSADLKDTLELERELSRVRGEIEQLQGQLNLLKSKTDLATVTVTIIERRGYIPPTKPTFTALVTRTFNESWQLLVSCGQSLTLVVVALAPWAAVFSILSLPIWWIRRIFRTHGVQNLNRG